MEPQPQKETLLSRRATMITALGRAEAFLDSFDEQRDGGQVTLRLEYLNAMWTSLEEVQGQLEDIEDTEEGRQEHADVRANFEPRLFSIKADLISKLPVVTQQARSPDTPSHASALSGLKLPTISLPEFNGDYMQWLGFHDTFLALIHSNTEVPAIQKFHYLRAALKGEAAQLIESIAISSVNYDLAWQTLVDRYANDYLLKKRHLQALFDIPSAKKESAASLHALVDEFQRHTKVLGQLGEPTASWSSLLEHLLCTKLPDDTLKAWEDHASTSNDPNYDCLIDFLQRRMRVLESMLVNHHQPASTPNGSTHASKRPPHFRVSSCASTSGSGSKCPACNQDHTLLRCAKFNRFSNSERQQLVLSKRLCHNCLRSDHMVRNCPSNYRCKHCNKRHHSMLHSGEVPRPVNESSSSRTSMPTQAIQSSVSSNAEPVAQSSVAASEVIPRVVASASAPQPREDVFLLTVLVKVVDAYGQDHFARALLDSASQPNLITERLARRLHLKRSTVNVTIQGAGNLSKKVHESIFARIKSRNDNYECSAEFLLMDTVTADLPAQDISVKEWRIPENLSLADPTFNKSQQIDMVLGAKHFHSFFPSTARLKLADNLPILVDSVFGWVVTGSTNGGHSVQKPSTAPSVVAVSMLTLEESMERFWQTEELKINDNYSIEERHCEDFYKSTTSRDETGRYIVRLPRKPDFDAMLGESRTSALRRYDQLERRLDRDQRLKDEYHGFMKEYLSLGHMRLVETDEENQPHTYYLPHHPVIKEESTTTKLRVVFDGSARTSTGFSLNEALCVGPVVQDDLLSIILRFLTYPVALVGDIAKMYRQVTLHPDDCPLQRILFRFSKETQVQTYELQTVTYGLAPSSFLATRTLQQIATDEGEAYPLAGPSVPKNFYVDDYVGGANSVEEAVQLRGELSELLEKGGFVLRKWASNRLEVLQGLENDQIATQSSLQFCPNESIKALGIRWEPETDQLRFDSQIEPRSDPPTKRSILSDIARLFDPLGLIAPVVVTAKILMQELWSLSCDWDEPVPHSVRLKWENFRNELPKIKTYRIDRYAFLPEARVELHTFADASTSAYGACTYVRCEDSLGTVKIRLLASKSKVAPLKRLTIARLELCACVLAAHLHHRIKESITVHISASYFWSDSAVCLYWLRAPPSSWKTFVANRVSEVQHYTRGGRWNHISGTENPADLVSRGMSVEDFVKSDMWKHGPQWLALQQQSWPISTPPAVDEDIMETKNVVASIQTTPSINPWFVRWSSYNCLLHVVAYCLRFAAKTRSKARTQPLATPSETEPCQDSLAVEELTVANTLLIRFAQQDAFKEEIKDLQKGNTVAKRSPVRRLSPFIDCEGVLRVGGRLNLSQLPFQSKHPALLPKNHPFTRLLAEHYHRKLVHGGGRLLLSSIREEYWPLDGRRLVKSIVRNCFRCARHRPVPLQQQIGQLPMSRVIPGRPFSVSGVDYAGPLYIKAIHKRAAPAKAYLCVFVCFITKAVHLELVGDLSTQGFLAALRRFIARRGMPTHLHSDNGKNFEGAKRELAELFTRFESREEQSTIASACSELGITWHLTPPKAPHFGGLWEAAVKTTKRHLFRQLGNTKLSFESYYTILHQIEAAINSRPLLPMSDDPNDLAALTPAHFLLGTSMTALPDPDIQHAPNGPLEHFQKLQCHVQKFWSHWRTEYLQEMLKDTKPAARNDEIQPGRMVIIVDDMLPTTRWSLARITAVHPGKDNITRVVSLRTAKGVITRPITKICLLPLAQPFPDEGRSINPATVPGVNDEE
ncbi:uncharacterized protein LOC134284635 [Aedes albopictus]|uniref:Integrase catalytic domain-containing protein n=1 Tax=Aedes albopictus TaxID=7160 RepID=A0ABM1Z3U9_AEDAL